MKLKTPSKTTLTEYILAPWHLRLRWWLAARLWWWCAKFVGPCGASPEQVNPLWRRW